MPVSVTMPALGESVTEGTVTRWLKQEGDQVEADEPLLEVSTDKVDTEIPAPASGVLTKIKVSEDETVDVGTELAVIGDEGGSDEPAPATDEQSDDVDPDAAEAETDGEGSTDDEPADECEDGSADSMGGDEADRAVEESASAEQSDQPSEPAQASSKQSGSGSGTTVTMPALGESVTEGTVTRWLKSVGDEVAVDEPLLEVSTDKVDTEIPSPVAGTLLSIDVGEDETVEVGATLATIGDEGSQSSDDAGSADADSDATDSDADSGDADDGDADDGDADAAADDGTEDSGDAAPETATRDVLVDEPEQASGADSPKSEQDGQSRKAQKPGDGTATGAKSAGAAETAGSAAGSGASGAAAYVTPLVRKLAAEHDVDLSAVQGSGVGGRIRKQDVLDAARSAAEDKAPQQDAPAAPAAVSTGTAPASGGRAAAAAVDPAVQALRGKTEKLSRLRTVIAKRMVESLQISAQLTTVVEVDITEIARLRTRVKADFEAREGVRLSFLPFFALATVEALKAHPKVNSSVDMDEGTVTYHDSENLGIAVDTERGLLVPVIHDAGDLNLGGIARKIADLADRTRRNKITPDELSGGTFTLTNTGSRGALFDTPIINQPQSAILGTGTVVKRPVVIDHPDLGEIIAVRSMIYLALSYDHRIVDGADAARFLVTMQQRLEGGDFGTALGLA